MIVYVVVEINTVEYSDEVLAIYDNEVEAEKHMLHQKQERGDGGVFDHEVYSMVLRTYHDPSIEDGT